MKAARSVETPHALGALRGFAFDLDGTIWTGPRLLPTAQALVAELRGAGLSVVFASNSSRHGAARLARQLTELGIEASDRDVVAAFDLVGETILRRMGPTRVLPLGTEDLSLLLAASGHEVLSLEQWPGAGAVVVGNDPAFDFNRLRAAARAVAAGAAFFAINMDARFPIADDQFEPGCGALAEAVAVASGVRPIAIGKPQPALFEITIERLGCPPSRAAMVGDSLSSDILGGRAAGMYTIWIDPAGAEPVDAAADLRVRSLEELRQCWQSGRPAGPAPALAEPSSSGTPRAR